MCNQRAPSRDKKFSQMGGDVVVPWSAPVPGPLPEGETDTMSNAQRSTLKWEKEETLGEMATVAPVLYTNVNFPNLLGEFPGWYRSFGSLKFLCELSKCYFFIIIKNNELGSCRTHLKDCMDIVKTRLEKVLYLAILHACPSALRFS